MPWPKTNARQQRDVENKNRNIYKRNDKERFRGHEPAPLIRAREPKLAVSNQGLALDHTNDKKPPREAKRYAEEREQPTPDRCLIIRLLAPNHRHLPREAKKKQERDDNFEPMSANVLTENVENLIHTLFSRASFAIARKMDRKGIAV